MNYKTITVLALTLASLVQAQSKLDYPGPMDASVPPLSPRYFAKKVVTLGWIAKRCDVGGVADVIEEGHSAEHGMAASCACFSTVLHRAQLLSARPPEWAVGQGFLHPLVLKTRADAGRKAGPTYALNDSQSVKTVSEGEARGIDGGKKQKAGNGTLS